MPTESCKSSGWEFACSLVQSGYDKLAWVTVSALGSLPFWHGLLKETSEFAALLAPIAALVIAYLQIRLKLRELRRLAGAGQ